MDQLLVTLLSLHYYIITLLSCKFTVNDNMIWYICLGSISKDFTKDELSEISLNGAVHDFSVKHSSI